ncbi:MAG: hypothetical protein J6D26_08115 [Clostridia bacterium]|nr:hypothetical protein [Clostridia bacterium]
MPDKKPNVLAQLIYAFQRKKAPVNDIVTVADKVIEEYIYSRNKLIHRKCKKSRGGEGVLIALMFASALIVTYTLFKIII